MSIRQEEIGCANYEYIVDEESMKDIKSVLKRLINSPSLLSSSDAAISISLRGDIEKVLKEIPELYR